MKIVKSIFMISSVLILAVAATNSFFTDQAKVLGNQFSTGTWEEEVRVRICHATGADNHYTNLTLPIPAILSGHLGHQCGNDIIPPFDYGDPVQNFPGQNWDATGQAIWNNNCVVPSSPPVSPL